MKLTFLQSSTVQWRWFFAQTSLFFFIAEVSNGFLVGLTLLKLASLSRGQTVLSDISIPWVCNSFACWMTLIQGDFLALWVMTLFYAQHSEWWLAFSSGCRSFSSRIWLIINSFIWFIHEFLYFTDRTCRKTSSSGNFSHKQVGVLQ